MKDLIICKECKHIAVTQERYKVHIMSLRDDQKYGGDNNGDDDGDDNDGIIDDDDDGGF